MYEDMFSCLDSAWYPSEARSNGSGDKKGSGSGKEGGGSDGEGEEGTEPGPDDGCEDAESESTPYITSLTGRACVFLVL